MLPARKPLHELFHHPCGRYHCRHAWNQETLFPHRFLVDARLPLSTAAATPSEPIGNPPTGRAAAAEPPSLVRYLVASCGFSKREATDVSKPVLGRVTSPENPAAVLSFLREQGFTKSQLRQVVSNQPAVLCASVSDALEPKIRALKDAGFSGPDISQLFSTKPRAFSVSDLDAKVRFWAALFDSKERLLKAIIQNRNILFSSLDEKMKRNVSLLHECLESKHTVTKLVSKKNLLLTANTDMLKEVIKRVDRLGIPRDSGLFGKTLSVLIENSNENFNGKCELLKSFGWSEADFLSAIQKNPTFLGSSKKKIQSIMDFLLKEVGCEPSYVAMHPNILTFSLEGRMMPRHHVLRRLTLNSLIEGEYDFYNVVNLTEKYFLKRFVLRHREKVPELYQSYVAACNSGNSSWSQVLSS